MKRILAFITVTAALLIGASQGLTRHGQFGGFSWGSNATSGPYTLVTGATNTIVLTPNGLTPTEADLQSHKYHHHNRVAANVAGTRIWTGASSSGTNEDASGQMTVVMSSTDGGLTWSAPTAAIPPQSTFTGTGASNVAGTRISYPRDFEIYGGKLYLVGAIDDEIGSTSFPTGSALLAIECKDDGSIGTPFLISTATYTPQATFPSYNYDPVLGPPLLVLSNNYGTWGGSYPGNQPSEWLGYIWQSGNVWTEPATINLYSTGNILYRLTRQVTGSNQGVLFGQISGDNGGSWGSPLATTLPNSPSAVAMLRLTDGRVVVVGNPINGAVARDPLYIAVFNAGTGNILSAPLAIRQGLSGIPVYPGTNKGGGAQYPGLWQMGDTLLISYDVAKETTWFTSVSISNIPYN